MTEQRNGIRVAINHGFDYAMERFPIILQQNGGRDPFESYIVSDDLMFIFELMELDVSEYSGAIDGRVIQRGVDTAFDKIETGSVECPKQFNPSHILYNLTRLNVIACEAETREELIIWD